MEMFFMGICMSILGFGVAAAAFGAATRDLSTTPEPEAKPQTVRMPMPAPARFFAAGPISAIPQYATGPISALLSEIEDHVRLEQAAAESFLASPTIALLHSRTISPLVQ